MTERILKAKVTEEQMREFHRAAAHIKLTDEEIKLIESAQTNKLKSKVLEALDTFVQKRSEYGDTDQVVVGALKAIYPNGIPKERFYEATFALKIIEKLSRLSSTSLTPERLRDAYKDVVGYGLLGVERYTKKTE